MADRYSTQNLSRVLTTFATQAMGRGLGFIADKIMPIVKVPTTVGKYYEFQVKESMRDDFNAIRAPKTESQEVSRSYSEQEYALQQYGLRELVADEEMDNADRAIIDPERDSMALITQKLKLAIEVRIAALVLSTVYITKNGAATACWDAASGVDIEGDIDAGKQSVRKYGGMEPNTIVIPPDTAIVAKKDPTIRDLVKHTKSDLLVIGDLPPQVFGLDVLIPSALIDSAVPGISAQTLAWLWATDNVLVAYVEKTAPSKRTVSLGYQLRRPIAGALDVAGFRYREQGKHSTVIEGLIEQNEKLTCALCGYLITNTIT